ncbi:MAG: GNAT family N-acetyltransferase [Lachnospiraceae bacterium]|nr:GNAT family N-acetyltransferase [Lachnospiraceae bacterium]
MDTGRLQIRKFTQNDLAAIYEYLSDPEVVKYEPYPPLSQEQCGKYLSQMADSKDFWAVCLRGSGKLAGQVYLSEKEQNTWEVGYVFNRKYQNQGMASEAVHALISYIFERRNAHRVVANCNPDNTPSWRLLERLGFRKEGYLKENVYFNTDEQDNPIWQDTFEYGVLCSEWDLKIGERLNNED